MTANNRHYPKASTALIHIMAGASLIAATSGCTAPSGSHAPASRAAISPASRLAADAGRCEGLAGRAIGAGRVTSAVRVAAGSPTTGSLSSGEKAQTAMCIVRLVLQPVPGSTINAEVWLPEQWNGKLMGFGGGGFDGSLNADSGKFLNPVVARGFASVISDVGHTPTPTPGMWVHGNPERVVDFGHRGTHLAAQAAKQVISAYYGTPATLSYFQGCSNGGRDGLSLASRYPQDYDAIVAGAPAIRYTEVVTQLLWYSSATRSAGGKLESKLGLVHDAILKQCDTLDGAADGILENPRACKFDPAVLQCRQGDAASCLTAPEVGALRRIYGGAKLSDGSLLIAPPAPGSEGNPGNWAAWITGPVPGIAGEEFYRWMVYDNPQWKAAQFDLDRDYGFARKNVVPIINADNPDLSAFIRRGGKLIMYQGWDDPAITAGSTVDYFEAMRRTVGQRANRQTRLFMVPGMAHCGGGPGATSFDMQAAMERWVDTGKAPDSLLGTKPDVPAGQEPYTHPLCAWPATAHYNGTGSVRDARNFTCKVGRSGV